MLQAATVVGKPPAPVNSDSGGKSTQQRTLFRTPSSSSPAFLDSPYSIFQDVVRSNELMADSSSSVSSKRSPSGDLSLVGDQSNSILSPSSSALLTASDSVLEASIAKFGAVNFVRQLASDIAERDKTIWKLSKEVEDKVRVLSAMLRARSNSAIGIQTDIDCRLRDIDLAIEREFASLSGTSLERTKKEDEANELEELESNKNVSNLSKSISHQSSTSKISNSSQTTPSIPSPATTEEVDPHQQEEKPVADHSPAEPVPEPIETPPAAPKVVEQRPAPVQAQEVRKMKSTFRLPFFWKGDDRASDDERDSTAPITKSVSHDPSASSSTSTLKVSANSVQSSSVSTRSGILPTSQKTKGFSIPLFPEESSLPPLITTDTSSNVRNNVNSYLKDVTEVSIKHSSRRKQHVIAPEREIAIRTGLDSDNSDDEDLVLVNEKGEEERRSSSSDELTGSSGSFKSTTQSPPYEDESPRNEISSSLFSAAFKRKKAKNNAGSASSSSTAATKPSALQTKMANGIRERVNLKSTTYEYDYDDEKPQSQPRKSRFDTSSFPIYFRGNSSKQTRPRSRSRGSVRSRISQKNSSEWQPSDPSSPSDGLMASSLVGASSSNAMSSSNDVSSGSGDRGPVELENIVPQSIQPPTLLQSWGDHYRSEDTFLLTDRFGFIYDRQHRPVLPPNDVHSTHAGYRFLENIDGGFEFFFDRDDPPISGIDRPEQAHLPTEKASASDALVRPVIGASAPEDDSLESVKTLLSQLTDLHDSLQRVQKARWDDFLRKINDTAAESSSPMSMETGELFGFHGRVLLSNKILNGRARYKEFKALVLGGIPVVYRSKLWSECGGADSVKVPGVYEELVNLELHRNKETEDEALAQIDLDLYRTMPSNVFFGGKGPGVPKLKRVLLAFSRRNPDIGYCQGMNMIAGTLLLTHATEEDAFWSFVSVIEKILPAGYYSPPLLTSRADQRVLKQYLRELQPKLWDHLVEGLGVDIEAITFNWFLSCFTDCLPAEVLFRVWDVFMCVEGEVYLFRIALSLFRIFGKQLIGLKSAAEVYSFMKDMSSHPISIEGLIRLADSFRTQVRMEDVARRRKAVINRMESEMRF